MRYQGVMFLTLFWGLVSLEALSQTTGDYRSNNATFNWSTNAGNVWQRWNGAAWISNPVEGYPGQTALGIAGTVTILNGHTVTLDVSPAQSIGNLVIGSGTSGSLVVGNNGTNRTLTMTGDVSVSTGATFRSAANAATGHIINIGGNLTNDGTFNLNFSTDVTTVNFTGPSRTISGSGATFTFRNLTRNTSATNLSVNSSILINGTLDIAVNSLVVVGSNANITLGTAATITATSGSLGTNRHIQLDGTTGNNSNLIRTTTNAVTQWQFTFPIGTSTGGYTPLVIPTITTAPTNNSTLSVKAIYNGSTLGQLRRTFRLVVTGNAAATTFTNAQFNYNSSTDVSSGDVLANYSTIWYLPLSTGVWTTVTGTAPGASFFTAPTAGQSLQTGTYYYTIGNTTAYPTTWYSFQTGVWSNPDVWTQDPSGTNLINPLTQIPEPGDQVVILNGFTVTVDINSITTGTMEIEGGAILDLVSTSGHNLGTVSGSGLLRMNGVNLPTGIYTSFVSASAGGTIEYYNTGGTLSAGQTVYNKLIFSNTTGSAITYISANNLTINSTLNVTQSSGGGTVTWQINNATNTQRTISISGDVTVSASGRIRVGTGNSGATTPHSVTLLGNLINNGSIKFFDDTDATYSDANYTSGATWTSALRGNTCAVTFSGTTDNTLTLNNQTDFYRLVLNKGTGQQAVLEVVSSATTSFRLFGPNNLGFGGAAPNSTSNNSLSIVNGTLKLSGNISITNLTEGNGGSYTIPQNGAMWMNGAGIAIQVTSNTAVGGGNSRMIIDYGLLRITNGTLNMGYSRGLLGGLSGQFVIEGGTVNTWQFRTTNLGSGNNFAYTQSGGTVNVGTTGLAGETVNTFPRFALPYSTCTFRMSGGTLNVASPITGPTTINGGIGINASASNLSVTGGTVNVNIPTDGTNFGIASTASFYNLNVLDQGGIGSVQLTNMNVDDGFTTFTVNAAPLQVLNNLTIVTGNTPILDCNGINLLVGGNFDIQNLTTFTPGANTTTFNGAAAQSWTHNGTITSLNNVVLNKSAGTLTLGGTNVFPNISGLTLTSGTLADGGKTITVTSTLSNSATHSGAGAIVANGPTAIGGSGGTFGNLTLQTNGSITTSGPQSVNGNLRLLGALTTINIGSFGLTVIGNIFSDAATGVAFTATKKVLTNGLRNDVGLTRRATSGVDLLFPVGSTTLYTPATINTTASTVGTINVRPVNVAHTNVTTTSQSVRYFWKVTSLGFSGITNVIHKSYTYSTATRDAASTNYRPARYDPASFTWSYGPTYDATAGLGLTTIPDFNTGTSWTGLATSVLDGEYTAGNQIAFSLPVVVYYSRQSGPWNLTSTWSNIGVGNATPAASAPPCATCPVVIGDGGANNHTVTIDANSRNAGSLFIAAGSTLDCGAFTGLNFGVNTSGTGTMRVSSTVASAAFPAGDFTDFLGPLGGTVEWYSVANAFTIPIVGPVPQNLNLLNYFNLVTNAAAAGTITMPAASLTIYNNYSKTGAGAVNTDATGARTLTINGDVNVTAGTFSIRNGNVTNLVVTGNTTVGGTLNLQGGGTRTHTFSTQGSITNNNLLTFVNGSEVVNLTFTGTGNRSFTGLGTGGTTLNLVTLNKGTSQTATLTLDVAGTVTSLSNNWLTLQNGTFIFNKTGGSFILTNTATNPYTIPATSKLTVSAGTVTISNVGTNDSDLLLAGAIEVSGGTLNIGAIANNNNNDIEYASAGTPTINVSNGNLYVNGAIRRPTTTIAGALVYNQTGGTVTIGGRNCTAAPNNTRGIFEIENNAGSAFTLTGASTLKITHSTGGTSFTDFYLKPVSSSVATASTVQIGDNALGATTLSFNSVPTLGNVTILGSTGNAQTVNMFSSPLSAATTLTINQASILNTNALNVFIGGDLAINTSATYNGSANTTTFNGVGAQAGSLSATSTFFDMTVNKSSGTVSLSGTSPTINNLNILSGVLDVGSLALQVNANIVNSSSQIGSGSVVMSGTNATHSITSNSGSFTNLTLGGAATSKNVTVTGSLTINGTLNFATTSRFLTIGSSSLTFGTLGTITGAGNTAFVRTSGSTGDSGVTKNWPAGVNSFTFAVGTINNYTPVFYNLNVATPGSLTVTPINSRHPTAVTTEQTLNYYWIVSRGASLVATTNASHTYSYASSLIGGSGGSLVAGYLNIANPTGWMTSAHGGSATTTIMTFLTTPTSNFPSANVIYHYSVGTTNSLPNPIVPVYSRLADASVSNPGIGGNWNSVNSWTTQSDGLGAPVGAAPTGIAVTVLPGARINMNVNGRSSFNTTINGTIVLGTSFGHSFGTISGTGTLRTATNTLPSGNYTAFVSSAGGTIEYVGPMTMNSRSTYNNLSTSGSGIITMTNTDLVLNGSLTIASGITLDNSANNRNIALAGNWINNGGSFTAGTGTVTFNGSGAQSVSGTSSFNNLVVSKSSGNLTLSGAGTTTVNGILTLTSGNIASSATHGLSLGLTATVSGGSASSFVSGPLCKIIAAAGSFQFPLGSISANKYRPETISATSALDTWCSEYIGSNPNGSYSISSHNAPLQKISQFEYWDISRSGATSADLTLSYNTGSYLGSDIGNVANLRVAHWNTGSAFWEVAGTGVSQSGTNITGTVTATNVTAFTPFTFGSLDADSPLPVELVDFSAEQVNNYVQLNWKTASELNNDFFIVERLNANDAFDSIATVKGKGTTSEPSTYQAFDHNPAEGKNYYRLEQTDFNGNKSYSQIKVVDFKTDEEVFTIYPNPATKKEVTIMMKGLQSGQQVLVLFGSALGVNSMSSQVIADSNGIVNATLELSSLAPGIYLVRVNTNGSIIKKLVIK